MQKRLGKSARIIIASNEKDDGIYASSRPERRTRSLNTPRRKSFKIKRKSKSKSRSRSRRTRSYVTPLKSRSISLSFSRLTPKYMDDLDEFSDQPVTGSRFSQNQYQPSPRRNKSPGFKSPAKHKRLSNLDFLYDSTPTPITTTMRQEENYLFTPPKQRPQSGRKRGEERTPSPSPRQNVAQTLSFTD